MTQNKGQLTAYNQPSLPTSSQNLEAIKSSFGLLQMAMDPAQGGVLIRDVHYGVIPGTGDRAKPTLLKPGADVICSLFHIAPRYEYQVTDLGNGHREYFATCTMSDAGGRFLGQGVGLATTMESKYRYRKGAIVCPRCGKSTVFKSKQDKGGGWYCWAKKSGCGATFRADDPEIIGQQVDEKIEYDNPADYYNTCLKMAAKRAQVAAVLTVTGASAAFSQDLDDLRDNVIEADYETDLPLEADDLAPNPSLGELLTDLADKCGLTDPSEMELMARFVQETAEVKKEAPVRIAAAGLKYFESFRESFQQYFSRMTQRAVPDPGEEAKQPDGQKKVENNSTGESAKTSTRTKTTSEKKESIESVSEECFDLCAKKNVNMDEALNMLYPDTPKADLTLDEWRVFRSSFNK